MKEKMRLVLIVFAISFLTSCASMEKSIQNLNDFFTINNGVVLPKTTSGMVKTYSINDKGTVEILGQEMIKDTHWLYVKCDYWSGCYMRCQGPKKICQSIATKSGLKNQYVLKRSAGENQFLGIWKVLDFNTD